MAAANEGYEQYTSLRSGFGSRVSEARVIRKCGMVADELRRRPTSIKRLNHNTAHTGTIADRVNLLTNFLNFLP